MAYTGSTGARWLDVALIGVGFLVGFLLFATALLTHPGTVLDSTLETFLLLLLASGVVFVAVGASYGKRTGWKVPDPRPVKAK